MILPLLFLVTLTLNQPSKVPMDPNADFWSYCTAPRPANCTRTYAPVCAASTNSIPKTYPNKCSACNNFDVIAFRNGTCEDISSPCTKQGCDQPVPPEPLPACAFQSNGKYQMVNNRVCCDVTPLPPYKMLIMGNCPKKDMSVHPSVPGLVKCKNRNKMCTKILRWVCGYNYDYVTKVTFSNECMACSEESIVGYTVGACPGDINQPKQYVYCPKNPPMPSIFFQSIPTCIQEAVCAIPYYGLPKDFSNGCNVCQYGIFRAYLKGTCASQIKKCTSNFEDCASMSSPSCAFCKNQKPLDMNSQCCTGKTNQVLPQPCPNWNDN